MKENIVCDVTPPTTLFDCAKLMTQATSVLYRKDT
jgi:hypothetical protein